MKIGATGLALAVLSTVAIAAAPAQASAVRIGNGNVGNGSAYELWRMDQGRSFQLKIWRNGSRSPSAPTCTYSFASNRDAMAFWRDVARQSGCPGQSASVTSSTTASSSTASSRSAVATAQRQPSTALPAIVTVPGTAAGSTAPSDCRALDQERAAVERLNWLRQNPAAAGRQLGLNLSNVRAQPALRVNPVLTQVARSRSEDMGARGYFSHVDPEGIGPNLKVSQAGYPLPSSFLRDRSSNFVESLIAGRATGQQAIDDLIVDAGINPPGHRIHLLAMDDFFQRHTEVGVGFACVPGSPYRYYVTVLTAYPER
ncbi:CAP domain-containing protein [Nodosilinea sp. PGN35]|uniref:CAP domain-containing protein n=1 Tax=Nodosilinea sp. PGN35 TaxID=3020489 RepID=UPI0023B2F00C|nr:CAP domain-containing protein [Nodosilinea sp. TSF1-S3]MDF0367395.1 hypothetical protein [Nodosilinea sp. TSF1-S3]